MAESSVSRKKPTVRIFISYRRDDTSAEALALYGLLEDRADIEHVYIDRVSNPLGQNWLSTIKGELTRTDIQLVLIGPSWLTAENADGLGRLSDPEDLVRLEIATALALGVTVIPLLLGGVDMPSEAVLPGELRRLVLMQGISLPHISKAEIEPLVEKLREVPQKKPRTLGEFFRLEGHIATARFVDIFLGVPDNSRREYDVVAVHLLRSTDNSDIAKRFELRCELWERVKHSNVVRFHDRSDYRTSSSRQFFAITTHASRQSLDAVIKESGGLGRDRNSAILMRVSSICSHAHDEGILLLSLDPSHFWFDDGGEIRYEGFDAAIPLDSESDEGTRDWASYCESPELLAPELSTGRANKTADVYALGMLLKAMEGKAGHAVDAITGSDRQNLWAATSFHCLSRDSNGRFQSPAQFERFLRKCVSQNSSIPELVVLDQALATDEGPSIATPQATRLIGRDVVTNFEFESFCLDTGYPIRRPDFNSRKIAGRTAGPFCPAVNVSFDDARNYCEWLSESTGKVWRLPTEDEWMSAALGSDEGLLAGSGQTATANYENRFGGPTVVEGFPETMSAVGCWDMLGNVWEWCGASPRIGSPLRTLKGGAYSSSRLRLSITGRNFALRTSRSSDIGFRVLREG